jgi:pheromone a factor receptor
MRYPEFPALSVVAAVLLLVPLPSQWRARNIATLTLILSTILLCVVITVNALVWDGHTRDMAPAWCDFGKFFHMLSTGHSPELL